MNEPISQTKKNGYTVHAFCYKKTIDGMFKKCMYKHTVHKNMPVKSRKVAGDAIAGIMFVRLCNAIGKKNQSIEDMRQATILLQTSTLCHHQFFEITYVGVRKLSPEEFEQRFGKR